MIVYVTMSVPQQTLNAILTHRNVFALWDLLTLTGLPHLAESAYQVGNSEQPI